MTVNGIGTSICGSRGDVGWGSFDAVECFVILFIPLLPIAAIHTFDWNGTAYRSVSIRMSGGLVGRVFLQSWRWPLLIAGFLCLAFAILDPRHGGAVLLLVSAVLVGLFALATWFLVTGDQRTNAIRLILGPHPWGSCDPVQMKHGPPGDMRGDTRMMYGTETYAEAVPRLIQQGSYSQAMWAARLSTALEDRTRGEELTDQLLADPGVAEALARVRRDLGTWKEVMLTAEERTQRTLAQLRQE
jgi:hypothetical protein